MVHFRNAPGWLSVVGAVFIGLGAAGPAQAGFLFIPNRSALGANDFIDWGVLGPDPSSVANPFSRTSSGGINLVVSQAQGPFRRSDEGRSWLGNFGRGDHLLYTIDDSRLSSGPITVNFGTVGITAGGLQIQSGGAIGSIFEARIEALDSFGNVLAIFTRVGVNTGGEDNSAIFLGIRSDNTRFQQLRIGMDSSPAPLGLGQFAVNRLDFDTRAISVIPEPSTLAMGGMATVILLGYAWRRRAATA